MTVCFESAHLARRIARAAESADRDGLLGEIRAAESLRFERLGGRGERLELLEAVAQDLKTRMGPAGRPGEECAAHLALLRHLADTPGPPN